MSEDDTAAEARKGRAAADAATTARAQETATARDSSAQAVSAHAGEPAPTQRPSRRAAAGDDEDGKPVYTLERLIGESSDFLGVPPHVAAGALHGADAKEMTVKDARARVKAWLKSEVAPDPAQAEEV